METQLRLRGVIISFVIFLLVEKSLAETPGVENGFVSPTEKHPFQEIFMHTDELIRYHGYPAETHCVVTEDGYILKVHRIPHGKGPSGCKVRPVIFLQHAIHFSSAAWVITGPRQGLAFILADKGYDVWLGNFRGNIYSKEHTNTTVDEREYWNFSWHEMAKYDLPAMIDYVLSETKAEKMFTIGHSTGANVFYIMCAIRPEYNSKVESQFSLAPDLIFDKLFNKIEALGRFLHTINGVVASSDHIEDFNNNRRELLQNPALCNDEKTRPYCQGILNLLGGTEVNEYDQKTKALIVANFPAGTSMKTIDVYAQCADMGKYVEINSTLLGTLFHEDKSPKEYNLTLVTVPVYLHISGSDTMTTYVEALILYDTFPNSQGIWRVKEDPFYHLDFLWGKNVRERVYEKLLKLLDWRLGAMERTGQNWFAASRRLI